MRLKSIKLAGFKSFVDATTVSFPHNMTSIVGPNGCGKSNVIDAVRWVMGESSAKNLRGESMTDVIFNGSSARQPVGQASIELLFDNTSGKLTGEYAAFSEISIRRKVTREGLSQYYLNGSKCRRRDVTDIFLGTGMGPRSYAIIEQGMISKLIESKPEELRVYLEEAAGISKYKERRRETENRIARTQDNLDRLTDIRDELGKQLSHLQRQANAAERYKDYKKEERLFRAKLYGLQWQNLDKQSGEMDRTLAENENRIEKAVLARTENESGIERARLAHESKQEEFSQVQGKFYEIGSEIAKLEQDIKYRRESIDQRVSAKAKLAMERATIAERVQQTERELLDQQDHAEVLLPELSLMQERLESGREGLEHKELEQKNCQEVWEAVDLKVRETQRTKDKAEASILRLGESLEEKKRRVNRLAQEKEELSALIDSDDFVMVQTQLEQLGMQVEEKQLALDSGREALETLRDDEKRLQTRREDVLARRSKSRAVLASLEALQRQAMDQDQERDAEVLREHGLDVDRRLFAELSIQEGWDLAVEHVLGNHLKAISTQQLELDSHIVEKLSGSVSLYAGGAAKEDPSSNDDAASLASVVSGAASYAEMLAQVKLAENFRDALEQLSGLSSGESVITPDGTWLSQGWVRYFKPEPESTGMVRRESQIRVLESELETLASALDELDTELLQTTEQATQKRAGLTSLEQETRQLAGEQSRLAALKSAHDARTEQRALRLADNQSECVDLEQQVLAEQESFGQQEVLLEQMHVELEGLIVERESRLEQRNAVSEDIERLSRDLRRVQGDVHALELAQQEKQSKRNLLQLSLTRLKEDEQRVNAAFQDLGELEQDEARIADQELQLEGLLETRLDIERKMSDVRAELDTIGEQVRQSEQLRQRCESDIAGLRERLNSLRLEKQALDMNKATAIEKVEQQDYTLEQAVTALTSDDSAPEIERRLEVLASRIQRLGAINLAAVDEFKEQSERKQYLDAQHEELSGALETLVDAIKKIDRETRTRFKETYDQVNEGLQRLFPKIFGGGSAKLELTDDDLLETGVAIIARPPGKKNSTIHLLSGGEKALTAIALIFAIFELNPAPFCMLDEVDAPLDDANVGRFAAIVKEMSDRVQFIYITHNKVSMEKADQLMGVTMSEPGVSRLVSVDVDEAAALAEA